MTAVDALVPIDPPAKGENRASWFWLIVCLALLVAAIAGCWLYATGVTL